MCGFSFTFFCWRLFISELLCYIGAKTDSVECYVHELIMPFPFLKPTVSTIDTQLPHPGP
jgi:hypothetical protein